MPSPRWPAPPEAAPSPELARGDFVARELRLPAQASQLQQAREYVDEAAAAFGFDASARFDLVFAFNEAVTNAIRHGTADDAGMIGLRVAADGDRLTMEVCDRGPFVAPTADDDPMADHGRGFALMAKLVDDVEVVSHSEGTIVRLARRRRGVDHRSKVDRD